METRNIDLHLKTRQSTKAPRSCKNKAIIGELIEKRPAKRERVGDWEINTIDGLRVKDNQALLPLTEPKTRYEMIFKIDGKAANSVARALTTLKEAAGKDFELLFKTITSDNGAEFTDLSTLLKDTTEVYFTHPYSFWERGTNENHKDIIQRFIPKETRMENVSLLLISRI